MGNEAPTPCAAGPFSFERHKRQHSGSVGRGFTTLELVIVIALGAIIAAIAASAHQTYTVRREVDRALMLTVPLRSAVERAYRQRGEVSRDLQSLMSKHTHRASLPDGLSVVDGRIDLLFGENASAPLRGRRISLTPYESAPGAVVWICGNSIPSVGLNPLGFAAGGPQAVQIASTIEPRFLPSQCR